MYKTYIYICIIYFFHTHTHAYFCINLCTRQPLNLYEKSRTARLELALRFAPPHLPQAPQQVDTYDKRGKLRFE